MGVVVEKGVLGVRRVSDKVIEIVLLFMGECVESDLWLCYTKC